MFSSKKSIGEGRLAFAFYDDGYAVGVIKRGKTYLQKGGKEALICYGTLVDADGASVYILTENEVEKIEYKN